MDAEVNRTIKALNALDGHLTPSSSPPSQCQREAIQFIRSVHDAAEPPQGDFGSEGAVRALLGTDSAYGGESTLVQSYDRNLLSIPHVGAEPVPVKEMLPPKVRCCLEDLNNILLDDQEWGAVCENPKLPRALKEKGIAFMGPPAPVMSVLGDQLAATTLAQRARRRVSRWRRRPSRVVPCSCPPRSRDGARRSRPTTRPRLACQMRRVEHPPISPSHASARAILERLVAARGAVGASRLTERAKTVVWPADGSTMCSFCRGGA